MDGRDRFIAWTRPNRRRLSYEDLVYRRYAVGNLKPHAAWPVLAIDTETYRGQAKLLSDSLGNICLDGSIDSLLSFLTHRRFRKAHTFAYNLQYDAEAVLKMLPDENVQEISVDGNTEYGPYFIKYIPKKMLTIRTKNRDTYRFFDIAQFYEMSLDKALKKYLGLAKTEYPHTARLNTDIRVWQSDLDNIIRYNKDDSYKTGLLADYLQRNIEHLFTFSPRSYISKASLAKDLVRIIGYIPDVRKIPKGAKKCAFYAYKGGRFEVLQRGYFQNTVLYDINSAYPSIIRNLVDVTLGEWQAVRDWTEDATYGFYLCDVWVKPAYLCPIAYLLPNGVISFPAGKMRTYLTRDEILTYRRRAVIEVIHGWEFTPSEIAYPFRPYIDALFAQKQLYHKGDYEYDLVKKMMNSLYGCFYEKHIDETSIKTGLLFNPVYASLITAGTRANLFLTAEKYGNAAIALQTDSILFNKRVPIKESHELGGWQLESEGNAVVLQSGIYQIAGKLRTRGMQQSKKIVYKKRQYKDVFSMIRHNPEPTSYEISQKRPLHLRECMIQTKSYSKDDINVWQSVKKTIDVNADVKRMWADSFAHGGEIFTDTHISAPWIFDVKR